MKTLELNQMENLQGGGDVLTDSASCNALSDGITGAATVIGFASWWTGAGAGLAFGLGLFATILDGYCDSL
jgi:hypothetical protein